MTTPKTKPHSRAPSSPKAHPTPDGALAPIRIILNESTAKPLTNAGQCFVLVAPGSWPDSQGQLVLHAIPCSIEAAANATSVALGNATAKPIRRKT